MNEFDEAVAVGRANEEAIELVRRHCRHARIEAIGGNSMVGSMLGLPMGMLEVRCEHAAPPRTQGHQALGLAIEFYEANCSACPYREATGELPNLATVAAERASEEAARREAAERARQERVRRHEERRARRRRLLAGEGHVVRDLGEAVDRIDRAGPRTAPPTGQEEQAARQIRDTAHAAPELFRPVLVASLLELATDAVDATAFDALESLVRAGRCPPRSAVEAACAVLRRQGSVEAAHLLAVVEPELLPTDLPNILDQLIELSSGEELGLWRRPSSPEGLLAASRVDLTAVTDRIIEHLASDDERTREAGADAAYALLVVDPMRIVALGQPLAASVRGKESGYAGEPHPTSAALRALGAGWRGEPTLTRRIVETQAVVSGAEARVELSRVPWFLQRFRQPWDASTDATSEAISFVVRRASGDWGNDAADRAADHLTGLAREIPEAVAAHIDELLAAILALCGPDPEDGAAVEVQTATPLWLAAMERESVRIRRDARRRRLAETVGCCAAVNAAAVLDSVQALFSSTTGDQQHDRTVRVAMLDVLESAVSPEILRDVLPITYTALLDADAAVRRGGIDLWVACARVADTLPEELTELAVPLVEDTHVIVHRRLLHQLPQLHLPAEMAPRLLPTVAGWIATYAQGQHRDPGVVESGIWALRSLARGLDDEEKVTECFSVALAYVGYCRPHDRQRLLDAWWPDRLRIHPAWTWAALATAASPELVDYYNQRREPLLRALFDQPQLLHHVSFGDIEPLSTVHGPAHPWRALEPVELLQSAGRWRDAAAIARNVEAGQPPGEEGAPGRRLAGAIAAGAELAQALVEGSPGGAEGTAPVDAVTSAVADLEASFPGGVPDGQLRATLDGLAASATAGRLLLEGPHSDPSKAATQLRDAAEVVLAMPVAHAAGVQRRWVGRAWQIAALLLRYDDAAREVHIDAATLLQAARGKPRSFAQNWSVQPMPRCRPA